MDSAQTRRHYVGGGNIAAVLGISPFQTPLQAWHGIMGTLPNIDDDLDRFFRRRKAVEPFAAEVLAQRGFKVIKQNIRHKDHEFPFFKAEIDAEIDECRNVEFKSVHPMAAKGWGEDGSDQFPDYVNAQIQFGLGVNKAKSAFAMAVIGFDEERLYPVERDEDLIAGIRHHAQQWWEKYVVTDSPPPVTTVDDVLLFTTPVEGAVCNAEDLGIEAEVKELIEAKQALRDQEQQYEALHAKVKIYMNEATILQLDGKPVATWKPQTSNRLDTKSIREAHPDLAAEFTKPSTSRVFRFK